jgi:hypothetical protein
VRAAESNNGHSKEAASNRDHLDYEYPYVKQHHHLWHDADNDIITFLSSEMQHQWIDLQYRAHCVQSWSECTQGAANLGNSPSNNYWGKHFMTGSFRYRLQQLPGFPSTSLKMTAEYDHCGTGGKDKDGSDIKEDVVVDAADTLSDKGGREGDNNNDDYGGKRGNMDNVVSVAAVLYVYKEEGGGSLIMAAPEGRTTICLTMRRTWWWKLPTQCPTRAGEEATTMTTMMDEGGARWTMSSKLWLYLTSLTRAGVESTTTSIMMVWMVIAGGHQQQL